MRVRKFTCVCVYDKKWYILCFVAVSFHSREMNVRLHTCLHVSLCICQWFIAHVCLKVCFLFVQICASCIASTVDRFDRFYLYWWANAFLISKDKWICTCGSLIVSNMFHQLNSLSLSLHFCIYIYIIRITHTHLYTNSLTNTNT